jgi:hypothetical protein
MPTANGPCRFGQYMHLIRRTLDDLGYDDVPVITITSNDGYSSIGQYSRDLIRTAWRAVVAQDILMKLLLKTRPYEVDKGATDAVYHASLADVDAALELQRSRTRSGWRPSSPRWEGRASASAPWRSISIPRARSSASWARSSAGSTPSPTPTSSG